MKKKTKISGLIDAINASITIAKKRRIVHQFTQDQKFNGRSIILDGKEVINFGSCSYLGLEMDERLIEASKDAVSRYGTQFSSSRTYVSFTLYEELEDLLRKMFGSNVLLSTCSTLGHQAVLPIVVDDEDAVIFDHQAHISMQDLSAKLKIREIPTFLLRHNRLDELETKIIELSQKHRRVWYFIDGIYSMYGDVAPLLKLVELLNRYKTFYLYCDDAHGMSWAGTHGAGYALSQIPLHPKMILCSSLAKGFASAGGVFVIPNMDEYTKVKNWGGPLTYSGPQQPAVVGASVASAKIHLSDEIYTMQKELQKKISFANEVIKSYQLPLIADSNSPIFFIGLGLPKVGYNMVHRMLMDGYYVNLGIFPAVPETCTGIRFTITRNHSENDIESMVKRIAFNLPKALKEEERTMEDIYRAFKIKPALNPIHEEKKTNQHGLEIICESTIHKIGKESWNECLEENGAFDWNYLAFLEDVFQNNPNKEHNWGFHYYLVKNSQQKPIVATFFTSCITKDDMLLSESVSKEIEEKRKTDKYYLTSKTFMMGTLLSNGQHLFIDKTHPKWKDALMMLLDQVWKDQDKQEATMLFLREFDKADTEMSEFLIDRGFIKSEMPDANVIEGITMSTRENYLKQFPSKRRNQLSKEVLKFEPYFEVATSNNPTDEEIDYYYSLYKNVKENNLAINDFLLPRKLFAKIAKSELWEIITLKVADKALPVGVVFAYRNSNYCPVMLGMDYDYLDKYNLYKQVLFQVVLRAIQNDKKKIHLGISASVQKKRFGAKQISQVAYLQMKDNYNQSVLGLGSN